MSKKGIGFVEFIIRVEVTAVDRRFGPVPRVEHWTRDRRRRYENRSEISTYSSSNESFASSATVTSAVLPSDINASSTADALFFF